MITLPSIAMSFVRTLASSVTVSPLIEIAFPLRNSRASRFDEAILLLTRTSITESSSLYSKFGTPLSPVIISFTERPLKSPLNNFSLTKTALSASSLP